MTRRLLSLLALSLLAGCEAFTKVAPKPADKYCPYAYHLERPPAPSGPVVLPADSSLIPLVCVRDR